MKTNPRFVLASLVAVLCFSQTSIAGAPPLEEWAGVADKVGKFVKKHCMDGGGLKNLVFKNRAEEKEKSASSQASAARRTIQKQVSCQTEAASLAHQVSRLSQQLQCDQLVCPPSGPCTECMPDPNESSPSAKKLSQQVGEVLGSKALAPCADKVAREKVCREIASLKENLPFLTSESGANDLLGRKPPVYVPPQKQLGDSDFAQALELAQLMSSFEDSSACLTASADHQTCPRLGGTSSSLANQGSKRMSSPLARKDSKPAALPQSKLEAPLARGDVVLANEVPAHVLQLSQDQTQAQILAPSKQSESTQTCWVPINKLKSPYGTNNTLLRILSELGATEQTYAQGLDRLLSTRLNSPGDACNETTFFDCLEKVSKDCSSPPSSTQVNSEKMKFCALLLTTKKDLTKMKGHLQVLREKSKDLAEHLSKEPGLPKNMSEYDFKKASKPATEKILNDAMKHLKESLEDRDGQEAYRGMIVHYERFNEIINQLRTDPYFSPTVKKFEGREGLFPNDIPSFLITPVQRPPRYVMLSKQAKELSEKLKLSGNTLATATLDQAEKNAKGYNRSSHLYIAQEKAASVIQEVEHMTLELQATKKKRDQAAEKYSSSNFISKVPNESKLKKIEAEFETKKQELEKKMQELKKLEEKITTLQAEGS